MFKGPYVQWWLSTSRGGSHLSEHSSTPSTCNYTTLEPLNSSGSRLYEQHGGYYVTFRGRRREVKEETDGSYFR